MPASWARIPDAPISLRMLPAVACAGGRFIVWGGSGTPAGHRVSLDDGAVYDLRLDVWTRLPSAPLTSRRGEAVIAGDKELFVWGGETRRWPSLDWHALTDGAQCDIQLPTWTPLPASPLAGRIDPFASWNGNAVLIWGGWCRAGRAGAAYTDGARYEPSTRTWRLIAPFPLSTRIFPLRIWTGTQLVVFGGVETHGATHHLTDGALYDPATDVWEALDAFPFADSVGWAACVHDEIFFLRTDGTAATLRLGESAAQEVARFPEPRMFRYQPALVGFDDAVVVFGVIDDSPREFSSWIWERINDRWLRLPEAPIAARRGVSTIRCNGGAVVWGGFSSEKYGADQVIHRDGAILHLTEQRDTS